MPRATSITSAPTSSQTLAISLMNEILVARNALEASLTISARADVGADERRLERPVEVDDRVAGPVAVVADHHAVGREEVRDRRALLEELRAGDVAKAALALLAEHALDVLAGAARHGRLHDQRVAVGRRHRGDDRVDRRQVGVPRVGRRRADRDEQQPRVLERVREVGREVQAVAVLATRSARPGSQIGMRPSCRPPTFAASMSMHHTSLPISAKPAAVTRPTYPVPMTPIGSRSLMRPGSLEDRALGPAAA